MKSKYLLIALLFLSSVSFGQATYPGQPLFGTSPSQDRTYRSLQLGTTTITDSLGATVDTLTLIPGMVSGAGSVFTKYYTLNLKDSCALAIRDVSASYTYSKIIITINAPSIGGAVYFSGWSQAPAGITASQWHLQAGATHIYPTASHAYILTLVCNGSGWYTESYVQD